MRLVTNVMRGDFLKNGFGEIGFVYKINFAVERRFAAGRNVYKLPEKRDVLSFKCVPSGTEQVKSLSIHKENGFLTFVHDQLSGRVKILARMLPYKGTVVAFVFDDFGNLCHLTTSSFL